MPAQADRLKRHGPALSLLLLAHRDRRRRRPAPIPMARRSIAGTCRHLTDAEIDASASPRAATGAVAARRPTRPWRCTGLADLHRRRAHPDRPPADPLRPARALGRRGAAAQGHADQLSSQRRRRRRRAGRHPRHPRPRHGAVDRYPRAAADAARPALADLHLPQADPRRRGQEARQIERLAIAAEPARGGLDAGDVAELGSSSARQAASGLPQGRARPGCVPLPRER